MQRKLTQKLKIDIYDSLCSGKTMQATAKKVKIAKSTIYKWMLEDPELKDMVLNDYKVRILDEWSGTEAITRVLIESRDRDSRWGTVGVSANIIEASWQALVDSIEYKLHKEKDKKKK